MRESQYQIPTTLLREEVVEEVAQTETAEQRQVAEFFAHEPQFEYTPEMHQAVKELETRLDWYRYEALHTPVAPKPSLGGRILGVLGMEKKVVPIMNDLIDQESLVGGGLFREEKARFWLNPPLETHSQVRDWYFSFTRGTEEYTIHYQTDAEGIHKIYNGHKHPFTEGEIARFVNAANTYEQRVLTDVYGREPVVRAV